MKKKVIIILLGLVLTLTAFSGVYAAWTQNVTVNGSITTVAP